MWIRTEYSVCIMPWRHVGIHVWPSYCMIIIVMIILSDFMQSLQWWLLSDYMKSIQWHYLIVNIVHVYIMIYRHVFPNTDLCTSRELLICINFTCTRTHVCITMIQSKPAVSSPFSLYFFSNISLSQQTILKPYLITPLLNMVSCDAISSCSYDNIYLQY